MIPAIKQRQLEIKAICRRFAVRHLDIFGSAATGDFHEDASDFDLLVEFEAPAGQDYADRYFGLLEALQELFGRPVNLVVASVIKNPYFRESVDKTSALLYAA